VSVNRLAPFSSAYSEHFRDRSKCWVLTL